jgi:hypothetical protein
MSRGSSISSVWLRTGRPGFDPRQRQRIFILVSASNPALGPTQSPVQWVPGILSPGVKRGRGVMLTIYPHPVSWLRMSRSYTSSPPRRLHGEQRVSFTLLLHCSWRRPNVANTGFWHAWKHVSSILDIHTYWYFHYSVITLMRGKRVLINSVCLYWDTWNAVLLHLQG